MLSRSQRSNLNQENPQLRPHSNSLHPTKTPARQALAGPSKSGLTGGKGLQTTTAKAAGRVLGAKDGNKGKGAAESTLLFPGKTSTSTSSAGPSCAPVKPAPAPFLPSQLRTPSPGLHKFAPLSFSPEVEPDVEVEQEEQELDLSEDREVQLAGKSSADYDEPFEPDFPLPNFKAAGFGAAFRATPFFPCEDLAEWEKRDEEERKAFKAELDEEIIKDDFIDSLFDSTKPIFPVPKRQALSSKTTNTSSAASRGRPTSVLSNSTNRRPPALGAPSTVSRPPSTLRKVSPAVASTLRQSNAPPASTKSSLGVKPSAARAPPASSLSRSLGPSTAAPRPRPPLAGAKSASAVPSRLSKTSSSSLKTLNEGGTPMPKQKGSLVGDAEAERELGIWGIEDTGLGLLEHGLEMEEREEFAFEL
ncbi:hypothetical protein BCR35DRAFT_300085 [Leucosporidium creatinivorum]|uniref:Uncharacterized protein n=1 Tax=Leucosporidium creatinivorum TaxID=106004 RepID=A0A1Y2FZU7_9BASI|nr:hypothetical protein BCR35DRAFT_300085 [Leucosporidium creatinivorum]